ncbi:MAG: DNA ligase-associated DEXH box helicase [Pirellulaceae bacterium]|nr:MAG: DNA ligase-associated DEXH box helicase [Pirellulaceae bacterium]
MFYYDRGLKLRDVPLALDSRTGQPYGFVSHAHADHFARHQVTVCTPTTARLLGVRWKIREVRELPYRSVWKWHGCRLQTFPAGHMCGSAMLLVETPYGKLLYTGDFQLRPSRTSEPAEVPQADVLVMESTYGQPEFRFPDESVLIELLQEAINRARRRKRIPLVRAYQMGKAQEATRVLCDLGYEVMIDPRLEKAHRAYVDSGVDLGPFRLFDPKRVADCVLVAPPPRTKGPPADLDPDACHEIVLSGWTLLPQYRSRYRADDFVPWSDHADFDELIECVERTGAKRVYCLHGQDTFIQQLARRGVKAHWLREGSVLRDF